MQPDGSDAAYVSDMISAGREAQSFLSGLSYDDFLNDLQLRRAIERDLEIFGEAARRLSDAFRESHPEIPWRGIIGQRNILAHDYGRILPERVWNTAVDEMADLVAALDALLAPRDEDAAQQAEEL
jgi:uncharacterized protein with HEPN domain